MNVIRRFIPYVKPYSGRVVLTVLLSALFSLLSAASVYIILPIMGIVFSGTSTESPTAPIESSGFFEKVKEGLRGWINDLVVVHGEPYASLLNMCILVVVLFLAKNVVKFASNVINTAIQEGIMKDIRNHLFSNSVTLPITYFNNKRSGELISVVTNEVSTINAALVPTLIKLTREPLQIITFLFLLLALSPTLTLLAFSTSIFTILFIRLLRRYIRRYSVRMQRALENITTRLQEAFQNIRIIKAYAGEQYENERFKKETKWYTRSAIKHSVVNNLSGPVSEIIAIIALVVVLYYGGTNVLNGQIRGEELFAFIFLLFSIMSPIVSVVQIPTNIQRGIVAGERVLKMLEEEPERSQGSVEISHLGNQLEVHDVTFSYRPGTPVLRHVSLKIARGETVALVGPSGGGKSTLMDLLIRFYDPDEGKILFDGIDIRELSLEGYRSLFGVVTQESLHFNDTVRNNICYNAPEATEEQIIQAAKVANAHDFIEELPNGYDTLIGDRGVLLSGGQRQRIAIARSIVRDPAILLFDEATSALDTESELLVQKAIEQVLQGRTAVVIAHRLSTIRNADKIAVIKDGKIVEFSNHDKLIALNGLYKMLYDVQFREEGVEG
ncbi:MAG: ABC transporter ATP-binding protein [Chlorobi bacterium]|nr:ABC transporter ATP-binding protein [Chlorobiota bacterium]